jgi:hypothetical protein
MGKQQVVLMKNQEITAATEKIVAAIAPQAQALFPKAPPTTIRTEAEAWVHKALKEARRLHPQNAPRQMAHARAQADEAIRKNLATIGGTMH